ncbi:MAG: putative nucleotide-diphospho-sugar transferase [Pseudomonadota bacterium]
MSKTTSDDDAPARGIILVATGASYLELAYQVLATIREHMPGCPVDLYTDDPSVQGFDQVHVIENPHARSKVACMGKSRFKRTLYLDVDTMMVAAMWDVFDLLDRFDIALAHDQTRVVWKVMKPMNFRLPEAFPQYNTGVIAWRSSPATDTFFSAWQARYEAGAVREDQPGFREEIWLSDLRIATLPPEYNLMNLRLMYAFFPKTAMARLIHSPRLHWHVKPTSFLKGLRRRRIRSLRGLLGPIYLWRLRQQRAHRAKLMSDLGLKD